VIPAKAAQSGDFTYTSTATEVTITGYTGAGGAVAIPASIDGTPVTAIGEAAFSPNYRGNQSITSVSIPDSVTSIGSYAFSECRSLAFVAIPASVRSIGPGAFSDCRDLTSVTIPDGVTSIEFYTFAGCSGLTSVTIPDSVTSISNDAFVACIGLTSVTIPASVTSIGLGAFFACSGLTNFEVDSTNPAYSSLGGVLYNKNQTTLILCPAGKSGSYTIPNNVTIIGVEAFAGCDFLTSVTIGSGVTSIGSYAFDGCTGLTSITIPNSVTSIGNNAFAGCSSLTSVTIPDSVTSTGDGAFSGCSRLTSVSIPAGVTSIGNNAFARCSSLTSVTIPDSVTSIGYGAFSDCSRLTSVSIPAGVTSIGNYAFNGCSGLTSVTIPNSVPSIGVGTFWDCSSLTSVTIGSGVTSIGDFAFNDCSGITHFVFTGNAPTLEPESFSGVPFDATVRYSSAATGWEATFGGLTAVADYLDVLTYSTANNQVTITGYTGTGGVVIIPASIGGAPVTAIGENAFLDSSSLTSVTIPASVTSIGGGAFSGCSGLTSVTIPASVTSIGLGAFSGCSGLINIEVDINNLTYTSVGGVLYNKDQTTLIKFPASKSGSYTIPNSVTSIGNEAFAGCTALTSVTIPDSLTSIGNDAFAGCSSLPRVMIPVATVLGIDAFPPTTTILRYLSDAQLTSRDSAQNAAGRELGREDVTNAPNTYGLYNLSQVQALNVGTPLLAKDSATGKFKLTVKAKKSTDLVNYSDMPFSAENAVINSNGEMEFQFTSPDNAAFFRIESR
jgi:hypothetical protein